MVSLIQALPQIITTIVAAIPDIISGVVNAVINNIPLIVQVGIDLLTSLIKNLPTIIVEIVKAVPQIISGLVSPLGKGVSQLAEVGGNLVRGLWQGLQQLAGWLWDKVSGWISSIWDGVCDFFGIHSPSDEMAWIGEMLVKGLSGSIDANGGEAIKAAEAMSADINNVMHGLAKGMETALPTKFNVDGNVHGTVSGGIADSAKVSGLQLVLNITNFNNCP